MESPRRSHVNDAGSSPFVDDPNQLPPTTTELGTPTIKKLHAFNDQEVAGLNEQIYALQYQLRSETHEHEMMKINYEATIRDLQKKILDEGKRADSSESNQIFLLSKNKELAEQLNKEREESTATKKQLESTISKLNAQVEKSYEDLEGTKDELDELKHRHTSELQSIKSQLQQVSFARDTFEAEKEQLSQQLSTKNLECIELESQLVKLQSEVQNFKAEAGTVEELNSLRRNLSEQLDTISKLQDLSQKQSQELESLREVKQYAGILEVEKQELEAKVTMIPTYKEQIASLEEQLFNLEQESASWKAYLDKEDQALGPEALARSLMQLKLERVSLTERLGRAEAELSALFSTALLESQDVEHLKATIVDLEMKLSKEASQRARLEKQIALASEEIELLRTQVHSYETEDHSDNAKPTSERLVELEKAVNQYREEAARLTEELSKRDTLVNNLSSPLKKRPRDSDSFDTEQFSEVLRKNRNLQAEIDSLNSSIAVLKKDNQVLETKLSNIRRSSTVGTNSPNGQHRVLQLRDNPTSKYEAIKLSMLQKLKQENETLIAQAENRPVPSKDRLLPQSTVERIRLEIQEMERTLQEQTKRTERLKQVFGKKSQEFREAVYALLGYQLDLLPNKKIRAKSSYSSQLFTFIPDPKTKNKYNAIEDGEYDAEIQNLITFWIKERGDIPCFLAALNLELYDKSTRASRF